MARDLVIELVASVGDLEKMRGAWLELYARSSENLSFMHPAFLVPWMHQSNADGFRPQCLIARRGSELAGIAPFFKKKSGRLGLGANWIGFPLYGTSPPFDILVGAGDDGVAGMLLERLAKMRGWDFLSLTTVGENSTLRRALAVAPGLRSMKPEEQAVTPHYAIDVAFTVDAYMESRGRTFRKEAKRYMSRVEAAGTAKFEVYKSGDADLDRHLAMAREVIWSSWKGSAEMHERGFAHLERVYRSLAADNLLRLRTLLFNGKPIAYLSEIEGRGNRTSFHNGYDAKYQDFSPGRLVHLQAVKEGIADGLKAYEFGGAGDYFRKMSNASRGFFDVRVVNPNMISRLRSGLYLHYRKMHARRRAESVTRARASVKQTAPEAAPAEAEAG